MIRDVTSHDHAAIRAVLRHAFEGDEEANLVEALRDDGDVLVELVAANDIAVFGHVAFSPLGVERAEQTLDAAALAPVAVLPAFQRKGVGAALIEAGVARCQTLGVPAIVVLGHADYYPRFGFSVRLAEKLEAPFAGPNLMAREFVPGCLQQGGRLRYAAAFGIDS